MKGQLSERDRLFKEICKRAYEDYPRRGLMRLLVEATNLPEQTIYSQLDYNNPTVKTSVFLAHELFLLTLDRGLKRALEPRGYVLVPEVAEQTTDAEERSEILGWIERAQERLAELKAAIKKHKGGAAKKR